MNREKIKEDPSSHHTRIRLRTESRESRHTAAGSLLQEFVTREGEIEEISSLVEPNLDFDTVEAKDDPSLAGVPSAVVQHNDWRGGGIIAVNYEARAFGVTRNMRGVPMIREKADLSKYREAGKAVISAITQFDSKFIVERASVDEAYLDITPAVEAMESTPISSQTLPNTNVVGFEKNQVHKWLEDLNADDTRLSIGAYIMEQVREAVFEKTGFPDCFTSFTSVPILYSKLKLTKLRGLGGKFGDQVLNLLNIETAMELSTINLKTLHKYFDEKTSLWLYRLGQGLDDEPVNGRELPKSIGCSKNFRGPQKRLDTMEKVIRWMKSLAEELSDRLIKDKEVNARVPKTLNINVGLEGRLQLIQKLNNATDKEKYWKPPITLLSLNASKFEELNGNGTTSISAFFNSKLNVQTQQSEPTCSDSLKHEQKFIKTQLVSKDNENVEPCSITSDYTNVDPSVLEMLPADIKQEIESQIKKTKKMIQKKKPVQNVNLFLVPNEKAQTRTQKRAKQRIIRFLSSIFMKIQRHQAKQKMMDHLQLTLLVKKYGKKKEAEEAQGIFRVLDIGLPNKYDLDKDTKKRRKEFRAPERKKSDVEWSSVWPAPKTFHPYVVPLPIRQGFVNRKEGKTVPDKNANVELMKIPNFLHATPPAIRQHCAAIKKNIRLLKRQFIVEGF
ncbi:POLH [Lepeophtheirus salmonis]|uniref:DNA polymerase eta n=1 Tax=Lepeophtheirus salmonis TaxID=72036 RepID=A0A7R8CB34_LEPSM|nr:POLH [Lepeophtheirus salmonis]CAF2749650.1 POLH [Lepeophtheirus salmonis]